MAMIGELNLADGLIWYFVFVYSTVVHEAGHAWAALKLGDDTAHRFGQVSLDPVPHMRREPLGMIVVPLLSWFFNGGRWMMGWASAPYDPEWAARYPRRAALMAAAGPAADVVLLLVAVFLMRWGLDAGVFKVPMRPDFAKVVVAADAAARYGAAWAFCAQLLSVTFTLQVVLVPFNLLPLPPLDGSVLPLLVLGPRQAERYQEFLLNQTVRVFGLVVAWQVYAAFLPSIFQGALGLLYR